MVARPRGACLWNEKHGLDIRGKVMSSELHESVYQFEYVLEYELGLVGAVYV